MRSSRLFRGLATTAAAVSTTLLLVAPAPAAATTSGCGFTVVPSPNAGTLRNSLNRRNPRLGGILNEYHHAA
jgi:hypothetical protein